MAVDLVKKKKGGGVLVEWFSIPSMLSRSW